jgi:hypothetical protein
MFYGKFDTQSFEIIDKAYNFEWLSDEAMILNQVDEYSDDQQFTSAKAGFDQCYTDI